MTPVEFPARNTGSSPVSVLTEMLARAQRGEITEVVVIYLLPGGGAGTRWLKIDDGLQIQGALGQALWAFQRDFAEN